MSLILVVDDDGDLCQNTIEILQNAGYQAMGADTAEAGLAQLTKHHFDLILLDVVMPGMWGQDALPLFRKQSPATDIIIMTAFATVDNAVELMRTGAADYLTKPFDLDQLLTAVRRCLEEGRTRRCQTFIHMDGTFQGLANPYRRQILALLGGQGEQRFMDIVRHLEVEDHTKVNFHLRVLREANLVAQNEQRDYRLTEKGWKVLECLSSLADNLSLADL